MNPWVLAFAALGPPAFLAGFLLRPLFSRKDLTMTVFAELQQPLADLAAGVNDLPAKVAAAVAAGDPQAAQDKADTISAVQTAAANAVAAINAIGQAKG